MKKFTLVFVLLVLVLTFATMYFFFMVATKIPKKESNNQVSTEETVKEEDTSQEEDLGPSIYEDYSSVLYEGALEEGRVIVLFFTANWCPICRQQEPINQEVFDSLDKAGVVGLRVHILDSETTSETEALAKKFDVIYQHTFVILDKKGAVSYNYSGPLENNELIEKIKEAGGDL